ncbi:hypothetical protein [Arsenophonus sp. PmNCSU2021_1]|uniref:hypothetical protein n=1 Tax=Arsenophonus sp. PmNCSU2021_1 TaxID=3118989 RepID=UPI002FF25935
MISSSQSASVNNIESSVASSPNFDPIKVEIDKKIDNKFVLVFSGFSGMGYENTDTSFAPIKKRSIFKFNPA